MAGSSIPSDSRSGAKQFAGHSGAMERWAGESGTLGSHESFMPSVNTYLSSTHYLPGTVLGMGDMAANK